jgi:hypothetical protein
LRDVAEFRARVQAARAAGRTVISDRDPDLAPIFARLREAGLSPRSSLPALESAIDSYAIAMLARSEPILRDRAAPAFRDHTPTLSALARAQLHLATAAAASPAFAPQNAPAALADALATFEFYVNGAEASALQAARSPRASPGDWSFLATVRWHVADLLERVGRLPAVPESSAAGFATRSTMLRSASVTALQEAVERDPTGVMPALSLARRAQQLGDLETAATAAQLALANDELKRLDPLAGLSDADRAFLRGVINTAPPPAAPAAPPGAPTNPPS